ncbi:hypothetical protein PSCICM_49110 [Pseudomonas cichorii]|uniref:Uncharacterized protein n=1 Tax=Pseudomonas cichorii TaxID=36746 RepID=A0ABQ1DUX4_PSECI|nr:hypothetical protein PSCICM_49110 [Pseudomonas cichorii]GFM94825.1 hypothetical protein PSCICP_47970 [Pseudomonas cichorii]
MAATLEAHSRPGHVQLSKPDAFHDTEQSDTRYGQEDSEWVPKRQTDEHYTSHVSL